MKKLITLLILILICFFSCENENKTNLNTQNKIEVKQQIKKTETESKTETKYVTAKSGLNYRKNPKKEIIGKFKYGKKLEIIEHTNIFESIKDENEIIKDEWLGVKFNNDIVYVFGGFLSVENPNIQSQKEENSYKILLPSTYRDWENENPVDYLNKKWLSLYTTNSKYYINKADYTIQRGYSECSGDSTKTIITQNKTLIYIKNIDINYGEIYHQNISKTRIWPGETVTYNYNNTEYKIRAEGEYISPEKALLEKDSEFYANVKNYKLYISTNNSNERVFLEEESFNDTFVKILFVGDIDSDGKLDFVFEANRDYEEERVILFLSSESKKDKIIERIDEIAIQFDC